MDNTNLSKKERDYLILIYEISKEYPVRVKDLAEATKVSEATAYEYSLRLAEKGLIVMRRGAIKLTEKGEKIIANILKAHRVLETLFFINGIDPESSCKECSKIDYLLSDEVIEKLYSSLGKPQLCPHGKPIEVMNI